jgi:uncharacterized membrane protein
MSWHLLVKYLHILAVTLTIGGMFARQLVRGYAKKSEDLPSLASLTHAAMYIDRSLVIPASNLMILLGIILAVIQKWPIFGFLQGASQNWLLASNALLVVLLVTIFTVFVPHNKTVEAQLQAALAGGHITPELSAALNDPKNRLGHYVEEAVVLVVAALMVIKPF